MPSKNKDISKFLSETIRSGVTTAVTNNSVPSGLEVFATLDSLPISGLIVGQEAFVEENSRIYVSNGSGWYNAGSNVPISPTWFTEPDASYNIADSATPLTITAKAQDSDNPNLANLSFGTDSAQYMVSVSNDSSVFTFTPKSADSIGVEVAAGNLTDSNGDFVYTFKWSDGISFVSKAATISYSPAGGVGGWWNRVQLTGFPSTASIKYPSAKGIHAAANGDIYQLGEQAADQDTFLVKYNSNGDVQWAKSLSGSSYYARPRTIITSPDSNSIYTVIADYGYGENMSGYPDPQLALVIKWTSAGAISWAKVVKPTSETTNYDSFVPEPGGVQLDSSGNLWLLGTSRIGGSGAVGSQQLRDTSLRKMYVAKVNGSTGALMGCWKLNSNYNPQQSDQNMILDGDDNVYICGQQSRDHSGYGFSSILIAKFNSSMTLQWAKQYGVNQSQYYDGSQIVKVDSNNDPYFTGYTKVPSDASYTSTLFKLNKSNGSFVWGKKHTDADGHRGLHIDEDDNIWLLSNDVATAEIILRKYSTDGTIQNQWAIDTNVSNFQFTMSMNSLGATSSGNLLMNFNHSQNNVTYEMAPIKMPADITAGTYGDLVISNETTTDATYSSSALTFVSYSGNDVGSLFESVNYNSGTAAIQPIVSLTISSENLDTIP